MKKKRCKDCAFYGKRITEGGFYCEKDWYTDESPKEDEWANYCEDYTLTPMTRVAMRYRKHEAM